jgi:hypothetical protein
MLNHPHVSGLILGLGIFCLIGASPLASARWGGLDDAPLVQKELKIKVKIRKDGGYDEVAESLTEIRNEDGRRDYANLNFIYHAGTTKLSVLGAKTIGADKVVHPVSSDLIEDKPTANTISSAFGLERQLTVAFPKVEINSQLSVRWEMKSTAIPIKNLYSYENYLGADRLQEKGEYEFDSEAPLYFVVNDPRGHLDVVSDKDGDRYRVRIKLKSPLFERPFDERGSFLRRSARTWFAISTFNDYATLGAFGANAYAKILSAKLPPAFQAIADEAKTKKQGLEQFNEVTARLSETMRYLMDWRAMDGGVIPRSLDAMAQTKFGDCKDMATVATAIYRRLGYEAAVAWVERDARYDGYFVSLPLKSSFNHAIVRVKYAGKSYWIDPTNPVSFAQGIPDDIAARKALVLGEKTQGLETIPEDPVGSEILRDYRVQIDGQGDAKMNVKVTWKGRAALTLASELLRASRESLQYHYLDQIAEGKLVVASHVDAMPTPSRILKDGTMAATLTVKNLTLQTTAGPAYRLDPTPLSPLIEIDTKDRVSDLFLIRPMIQKSIYELKNLRPVGSRKFNCSVDSTWLRIARKTGEKAKGFIIEDTVEIKQPWITVEELRSPSYAKFQDGFRKCFYEAAVVYQLVK